MACVPKPLIAICDLLFSKGCVPVVCRPASLILRKELADSIVTLDAQRKVGALDALEAMLRATPAQLRAVGNALHLVFRRVVIRHGTAVEYTIPGLEVVRMYAVSDEELDNFGLD